LNFFYKIRMLNRAKLLPSENVSWKETRFLCTASSSVACILHFSLQTISFTCHVVSKTILNTILALKRKLSVSKTRFQFFFREYEHKLINLSFSRYYFRGCWSFMYGSTEQSHDNPGKLVNQT
jgi:hypothetical protein